MAHADILDRDRIFIQTHWNEKDQIKLIPGSRWDGKKKVWTLHLSWAACVQLRGVFQDRLTIGTDLVDWAKRERELRVDRSLRLRNVIVPEIEYISKEKLYPFQRAGVDWMFHAGSALLADEMGTGKTIQILELLNELHMHKFDCLPALVISPNGVKRNWHNEAVKWSPQLNPYVIHGSAAKRKSIIHEIADDPKALGIINFESLRTHSRIASYGSIRLKRCVDCDGKDPKVTSMSCEVHARELNFIDFKTIIVDEAHRIKDPHAKQTRACWAIGERPQVTRRFGLTGTAIGNDPSDLWSIMRFIAPSEYPVRGPFVDRYCLLGWNAYGGLDVKGINPVNREEFFKILDPRFRRTPKALVLSQLPPKVYSKRFVELTPKQRKAYKELCDGVATRLPDGSIMVAPNDLELQTRLLQLASATLTQVGVDEKTDKPKYRLCDPSPKIDELEVVLEELGDKPVCVSAEHRQLIELAARRLDKLKISYGLLTGAQHEFEREVALRDFQAGKLRVLLFTIGAGGTGLTMTAADTMIRLQRSYSMILNHQGVDRVHRIGSEIHDQIHIIDIIAADTREENQLERLYEKAERLEEINRDRARLAAVGITAHVSIEQLDEEERQILASNLGD